MNGMGVRAVRLDCASDSWTMWKRTCLRLAAWDRSGQDLASGAAGAPGAGATTEAARSMQGHQTRAGGPRGGSGAPTSDAIWAAAKGCRAAASGWGCAIARLTGGRGNAGARHSGQSSVCWPGAWAWPSSSRTTMVMAPPLEQTSSMALGFTKGEAPATPSVTRNHATARRFQNDDVRRVCIARDYGGDIGLTATSLRNC